MALTGGSTSTERHIVVNRNVEPNVNDNGIFDYDARKNQGNIFLKLGKGASYTVENGLGAEQFDALSARLASAIGSLNREDKNEGDKRDAVTERTIETIKTGSPAVAQRFGVAGIAIAIAALIGLTVIAIFRRKKKSA